MIHVTDVMPGVTLEFVHIGGHQPLKRMPDHQELDGLGDQLLEEVLGQQGILLPEEGVEAEAIVFRNLGLRNVGEAQESVEPGGGGSLKRGIIKMSVETNNKNKLECLDKPLDSILNCFRLTLGTLHHIRLYSLCTKN